MNIKETLEKAYNDQYGPDNNYLHEINLTLLLNEGIIYNNLLYAFEDENNVIFYQEIENNHHIKIINKDYIISIEPKYKTKKENNENLVSYA